MVYIVAYLANILVLPIKSHISFHTMSPSNTHMHTHARTYTHTHTHILLPTPPSHTHTHHNTHTHTPQYACVHAHTHTHTHTTHTFETMMACLYNLMKDFRKLKTVSLDHVFMGNNMI